MTSTLANTLDEIFRPYEFEFFRNGLVVATVVGALCGLIGCYVVLRSMSDIGHGLSHSIFGGFAAASLLGVNVFLGAGAWGLVTALMIGGITRRISGPQRPRQLRSQTGLTAGGLSNLFDRLEARQLITRTFGEDVDDRRGAVVGLTPPAEALVDAISDVIRRTNVEQSALVQHTRDLIDAIADPSIPQPEPPRTPLEQLQRFARLGSDLNATLKGAGHEPTPGKALLALCAAATPDGTRPRELLDLTDLSSGGVTMLLDRLEDAGLINRAAGRKPDRRAVTITLTDLGRRELRDQLARTASHLPQIRAALTGPGLPDGTPSSRKVSGAFAAS